ncbi:hypothetical protein [Leptolyngbya ohadii]|uniref:hypothetical protein n=1 Tax=Leptolyngbya ohadii TaxID=1962290 RepID=UPI0015C5DF90|nr:hypothetical protein [Leptolyngbya ohadii]
MQNFIAEFDDRYSLKLERKLKRPFAFSLCLSVCTIMQYLPATNAKTVALWVLLDCQLA